MTGIQPQVLALVVCDAIHRDPSTGKNSLLGCFSALSCRGFPARHPTLSIYVVLTEVYGTRPILVRLVRPDGQSALVQAAADVQAGDPRLVVELAVAFHDIPLPAAEEVRVQVLCDGTLMSERRLQILPAT